MPAWRRQVRRAGVRAVSELLVLSARGAVADFERGFADPRGVQQRLLDALTARLGRTAYGRSLGVSGALDYPSFRARVPIVDYDALRPWIERQMREEGAQLVDERVLLYERTSGSSGNAKYVPYTASLQRSFSRMFQIWAHDLLRNGPRLRTGLTYFSVSPAFPRETRTSRGTPVGLEDDSAYLSGWLKHLVRPLFAAPPDLKRITEPFAWKRALATALLAAEGLEIVSIWSPSFFLALLTFIERQRELLASDLHGRGAFGQARALSAGAPFDRLWPELKIVSCWASAAARSQADHLAALFPNATVQPKGLLATEAPLTIPRIGVPDHLPLASEVFYEFEDEAGDVLPLAGLGSRHVGRPLSLVFSQHGGLVRYRIGDRVAVTGFHRHLPRLAFLGRTADVSDLVGEKLSESFVAGALAVIPSAHFRLLVPVPATDRERAHYLLLLDAAGEPPVPSTRVDDALSEGHHYRVARLLDQLGPVEVKDVRGARDLWLGMLTARGMKLGDVKDRALLTRAEDAAQLLATLAQTSGG